MDKINDIIIGAGISGLSFAYFTKKPYILFEASDRAGGLCGSIKEDGFTFDYSGHFIHIKNPGIKTLIENITGRKMPAVSRNAVISVKEVLVPFPFQANLYHLPGKVKEECVTGVKNRKNVKIYDDMPFIKWSKAMFGDGITKYFMGPYNEKLWNFDLNKMTAAWTAPFVPKPDAKSIIESAYKKNETDYGYNSVFYYPASGGCGSITDSFHKKLKKSIMTNSKVSEIDFKNKTVFSNGIRYSYERLVSTQALDELVSSLKNAPAKITGYARLLKKTSVRCVNLGVKYKKEIPEKIKGKHWIYFPEKKYPFYRAGVYSNASAGSAPKGCYALYVEFSGSGYSFADCADTVKYLKKAGIIGKFDEIVTANIADMPNAYVIFDKNRKKAVNEITRFLNANGIYPLGRYARWEYSFVEKNIIDAKKLAERLNIE